MSALTVRKPAFRFDDVPFQWQPSNPAFATFLNQLSFLAVAFERYIIKVLRDVLPRMDEGDAKHEAQLFFEQEAAHSMAHKRHIDAMIRLYPALKSTLDKACKHFDDLYARETTKYHLAYIANLEATFTPTLSFVIEHREALFANGHRTISSLFLWHAIEEIEHRSSALDIYSAVVRNRWYRITKVPSLVRHLDGFFKLMQEEFDRHVPREEQTAGLTFVPKPMGKIPLRAKIVLQLNLLRCFLPWHKPANEREPAWFSTWMSASRDGIDMSSFYGCSLADLHAGASQRLPATGI